MDHNTVLTAVIDAAVELLKVERDQIDEQTRWAEDLEADSLDLTELVMSLEDRFEVEVPEEQLDEVETVGDAAGVVLAALGANAS